jgi:hypothetical protein
MGIGIAEWRSEDPYKWINSPKEGGYGLDA